MKTIYIVQGQTGEYSDRDEWLVRAYANEDRAKEMVVKCDQEAERIRAQYDDWWNWSAKEDPNKYDPDMKMDYTGTNYYYAACELED